jgi:hypothetical protein
MGIEKETFISQQGSLLLLILGIVLLPAGIGLAGWYVRQRSDHNINKPAESGVSLQKRKEDNKSPLKMISLLGGTINFADDGAWKAATGGYYSKESGRCGRGTDFDESCLDHKMLIPANETFTNPDQFQVNISFLRLAKSLPPVR